MGTICIYDFVLHIPYQINKQTLQQINGVHSKEVIIDLLNTSQDGAVHKEIFVRQACLAERQKLTTLIISCLGCLTAACET